MIEPYNVKHFHSLAKIREPARKLCEYLLAAGACDETAVMYALDRQENLRAKGYDPLIGMLLLDAGVITKKDLTQALKLQDIDSRFVSCDVDSLFAMYGFVQGVI